MGWFDILTDAADILLSQDKTKAVQRVNQRQFVRSVTEPSKSRPQPRREQVPVIRPTVSVPIGGVRASEFYMRVDAIIASEDKTSDNLVAVGGNIELGELHVKEYLHFRAPKITPLCLQCVQILNDMKEDKRSTAQTGCSPLIILKARSKAEIEIIYRCVGKYYSCRICNMDYKDKF